MRVYRDISYQQLNTLKDKLSLLKDLTSYWQTFIGFDMFRFFKRPASPGCQNKQQFNSTL